jgi:hypothetical protein
MQSNLHNETNSFIWYVLILFSCNELPDLNLPEKTTEGKNTLGCIVDNKIWTNYGIRCTTFGCEDSNLKAELYRNINGEFELTIFSSYTVKKKDISQRLIIIVENIHGEGLYDLAGGHMQFLKDSNYDNYRSDDPQKASVSITKYDTINMIVSGEFYGQLNNQNRTKEVAITDGRFDIKINKRN